jgi:4-hydroxy-tetrahydrodipicolinate synthase
MSVQGVLVPLVTPLHEQGAVCGSSVSNLMACSRHSASGYVPCLTSGEGWKLTQPQWAAMVRFTLAAASGDTIIVGIERPTTQEVIERAREAQQLGARTIILTSPFGAAVSQRNMVAHYRAVHDACDLDLYIYNESALSGNETTFETLMAIAGLPRVVGIKDSVEGGRDPAQIRALQNRGLSYFIGWEQQLARGVPADGSIVSLANLEPALCRVAHASSEPLVHAEVMRFTEAHALLSPDWYRHIKTALHERGVIATDRMVPGDGQPI